jgi:hypothetical protein
MARWILSAGAALALLTGCQLGYFVREPRHSHDPRRHDPPPPTPPPPQDEDAALLERGERMQSLPPEPSIQPSEPSRVESHIYYVPTCSCWYCCRYRSTWIYPRPYWGVSWSRRGWGWGIGWGW